MSSKKNWDWKDMPPQFLLATACGSEIPLGSFRGSLLKKRLAPYIPPLLNSLCIRKIIAVFQANAGKIEKKKTHVTGNGTNVSSSSWNTVDLPMFRSMGFQLMSSLMFINLLQKFTNKEIQILHQVSQVQQGHTQSRWIRKPFSFWWAHGNWGSNLNLKKMLRRFYGWYLFLLQKNTLFSIHIFPYDFFLCVFCRFSFKLGCISSSVKARKKKSSGFFSSDFLWATKTFPNLYPTWTYPQQRRSTRSNPLPRNLRLRRHFFLGDPIQGSCGTFFGWKGELKNSSFFEMEKWQLWWK